MEYNKKTLIRTEGITKSFKKAAKQNLLVLDAINLALHEKEFIAILGKSGSGKSTFLRIIAGLIKPSFGKVYFREKLVTAPTSGIAMVFQSFALFPWLSVLENVELGLEAQGIDKKERRRRALKAIDTIGLDGFESAYPKELSGGMRQRVGFARALVLEPQLLLMDEPFSALDVLTSENLRNDLLDIWLDNTTKIQGILCVTHDIAEAILMANRIIIFGSDPGSIQSEIKVHLPYPRDPSSKEFRKLLDTIYISMTTSERSRVARTKVYKIFNVAMPDTKDFAYRLPEVDISGLTGLVEAMDLQQSKGKISLPDLAESLDLDVNSLFPLTEVLDMLRFAKISEGDIFLTESGRMFAKADILERKKIFAHQILEHIPLAKHIKDILDNSPNHKVNENFFLEELEEHFSEYEAERILNTIIAWGRYAEIFAYDYDSGDLSLENPQ